MHLTNAIECFLLLADADRRLAPRTIATYRDALDRLDEYALAKGRARLTDFTPNLVRACATWLMEDGHERAPNWQGGQSAATSLVVACRTMVRRLREEYPELVLPDLSAVRTPKKPQRIQTRLKDGEFAALEAAIRLRLMRDRVPRFLIARDLAILQVLANTGLRANECSGLDLEDIDLDEGTLRVRRGKFSKWRILSIVDPDPDPSERDGGEVLRALVPQWRRSWTEQS